MMRPGKRFSTNMAISSRSAAPPDHPPHPPRPHAAWRAGERLDPPCPRRRLAAHSDRRVDGRRGRGSQHSACSRGTCGRGASGHEQERRARERARWSLAVRPVQIDPYWQHGGHAAINSIAVDGTGVSVNDRSYAAFSRKPESVAVADFDNGDVVRLIEKRTQKDRAEPSLRLRPPQRGLRIRLLPRARRELRHRRFVADAGRRHAEGGGRRSTPCARGSRRIGGRRSARERSRSAIRR